MAVALIYGPAGSGKTTNSTLVKGGFVGIENGKLKEETVFNNGNLIATQKYSK